MMHLPRLPQRWDLCLALTLSATVAGASVTLAKKPTAKPVPVNTQDKYGNVRAVVPPRLRPAGVYPGSPTVTARQVYGPSRRSQRRTGRYAPFGLPGGLLRLPPNPSAAGRISTPLPIPTFSTTTQTLSNRTERAFQQFGGFDPRNPLQVLGDESQWFTRKYGLIRATSFDAPVLRSQWRRPGVGGFAELLDSTPFSAEPNAEEPGTATLDDLLVRHVQSSYDDERAAAWERFRSGQYRQAALGFETAYLLNPEDFESRIGEMFCYISLDAPHTAVVAARQLSRRAPNPFMGPRNIADRYGSRDELARVRIAMRLSAQSPDAAADVLAMDALALWYLGDQQEAAAATTAAARASDGDRYRDWPDKIASAVAASTGREPKQ